MPTRAEIARARDASHAQNGASNPIALASALVRHMTSASMDTDTIRKDPALRLIAHQLAYLFDTGEFDRSHVSYSAALDACEKIAAEAVPGPV